MLDDARIFHVNVNCSDLAASRAFYLGTCGLTEGIRTTPDGVQPGTAFGLDRARWDAWILVGADGFDGGAIDLLAWQEPSPVGRPPGAGEPGFARVVLAVADATAAGPVTDPDGVRVELVAGTPTGLTCVTIACADLDASLAFYRGLGFRDAPGDDAGVRVLLDAPGGGPVRLGLDAATAPGDGTPRAANTLGIWRTALLVADLDATVARLRAAGIALLSDPQAMAMGPGVPELRFVCFRGPDHEVIELIESPSPTQEQ
ncbi:MAG TPA: VOC family protein [Lapillicoccus sp.]|nr:VOC family protein [Lapillicoccus sp.]